MRLQNGFMAVITLIVAAIMTVSTVYSDHFTQASAADLGSFDALAHALFDDVLGAGKGAP